MKGILINTEYCTGCHSCEVACKKELGLGEGEWTWTAVTTKACNLCEERVAKGKMPMCVQHCQAWCMYHGEVEDLVKKMDGETRWVLLTK